jgi:hypothetical protein
MHDRPCDCGHEAMTKNPTTMPTVVVTSAP